MEHSQHCTFKSSKTALTLAWSRCKSWLNAIDSFWQRGVLYFASTNRRQSLRHSHGCPNDAGNAFLTIGFLYPADDRDNDHCRWRTDSSAANLLSFARQGMRFPYHYPSIEAGRTHLRCILSNKSNSAFSPNDQMCDNRVKWTLQGICTWWRRRFVAITVCFACFVTNNNGFR